MLVELDTSHLRIRHRRRKNKLTCSNSSLSLSRSTSMSPVIVLLVILEALCAYPKQLRNRPFYKLLIRTDEKWNKGWN